ncbi:hypothetical protein PRIPAC_92994, partial [Pristionchus pacificus]|uniref:Endo/exonuclease/phosphatase domain-containing protein n=1 Tax=Pristionchus pacificus TaxID=54126 RepID=A0A2A6BR79_PRIPA
MIFSTILLLFHMSNANSSLTVMTFNMYHFGAHVNDGLRKIADQISFINPDIVALQLRLYRRPEKDLEALCSLLGEDWSGALNTRGETDSRGVITRHKIIGVYGGYSRGYNVRIQLRDSEQEISVWSLYLHWKDYGPYEARKGNATTLQEILRGEYEDRTLHNIRELLEDPEFVRQLAANSHSQINNSDRTPVIVAGDFNTPSHLDWTEATRHIHFGWTVEWPVTKLLQTAAGMTDSFREVHPDPLAAPGHTWGVYEALVKDRIDFIFYRGPMRPVRSFPFAGTTPVLYPKKHANLIKVLKINEWPSDHYAVVTKFEHRTNEVIETKALSTTATTSISTTAPPTIFFILFFIYHLFLLSISAHFTSHFALVEVGSVHLYATKLTKSEPPKKLSICSMIRSAILLFFLISNANCSLRVMTFNMFHFGKHVENGLRKVADQIKYVNPDVVALQVSGIFEAGDADNLDTLCGLLGEEWSGDQQNRGNINGRGVITRHKIVGYYDGYSRGYNLRIQLRGTEQEISVWSVYLSWKDYGPDAAKKGATVDHIMSQERDDFKGRVHNIRELLGNEEFVKQINNADFTPVIVAGDFNTPSHLDWTNATKHSHFGYIIEWPTTKLLTEQASMTDSFREVHSDPLAIPGSIFLILKNTYWGVPHI